MGGKERKYTFKRKHGILQSVKSSDIETSSFDKCSKENTVGRASQITAIFKVNPEK